MNVSRFESSLTYCIISKLLLLLDDDTIAELARVNHGVRTKITPFNEYWRGLYGHRFHWRYVKTELGFLLWYRNKLWRETNQWPIDTVVDWPSDAVNGYRNDSNINWYLAYHYRRHLETNWRGLNNQRECYEEYSIGADGTNLECCWPINAAAIFVSGIHSCGSTMVCLRPSELPMNIESAPPVGSSIVSCPFLTSNQLPTPRPGVNYWLNVVVANEYYKLVEYKDGYYAGPTYSDQVWISIKFSFQFDQESYTIKSSGRWAVFFLYDDPSEIWLMNMATGQEYSLAGTIRSSSFIVCSDQHSITFLNYNNDTTSNIVTWELVCSRLLLSGNLESHTTICSQLQLPQPIDHLQITSLDTGYIYATSRRSYKKPIISIYSIKATDEPQQPICSFKQVYSVFRLNRTSAVVQVHGSYKIVDLISGNVMRSFNFSSCSRIHPIIGSLCLFSHYNYFPIIDISNGKPTNNGINCLDKDQGAYYVYPTFFLFHQYTITESIIFDFTTLANN
ncbi:hypothetical protein BDF22DRAFT_773612 [Syncephalis plumigaleata]|nr:hypothetical protein BDF22DRAFT_773612 [Syncephalis plumigaleata]